MEIKNHYTDVLHQNTSTSEYMNCNACTDHLTLFMTCLQCILHDWHPQGGPLKNPSTKRNLHLVVDNVIAHSVFPVLTLRIENGFQYWQWAGKYICYVKSRMSSDISVLFAILSYLTCGQTYKHKYIFYLVHSHFTISTIVIKPLIQSNLL